MHHELGRALGLGGAQGPPASPGYVCRTLNVPRSMYRCVKTYTMGDAGAETAAAVARTPEAIVEASGDAPIESTSATLGAESAEVIASHDTGVVSSVPSINGTSSSSPLQQLAPPPSLESWFLALFVALSSTLSRMTITHARRDPYRVQRQRERSRAISAELRARRDEWRRAEAARTAGQDLRRVEEAAARVREAAARAAEDQKRYREEAQREAARVTAEREAQRRQYEEQQAQMEAEYAERVKREQAALAEARRAEEERRREEEARREAEEAARRQREEEERRQREEEEREAARVAAEERKRLESEKQRFAVRIEGSATVERAPKGTPLPGPLRRDAVARLTVVAGSLVGGGQSAPVTRDFGSLEELLEAAPAVAGAASRSAADAVAAALRLKAMTGEGPMHDMEEPEREHWMAMSAGRAGVAALAAARTAAAAFQAASAPSTQPFEVRTEIGVLPVGHPGRWESTMAAGVAAIEAGDGEGAAVRVIRPAAAAENEAFYADSLPAAAALPGAPRAMGTALELAHFLGRMLHDRPAKVSDAPAWFQAGVSLVLSELRSALSSAPPDTLEPLAGLVNAALGASNPVAVETAALAEANVSPTERTRRAERERAFQSQIAAQLLAEEWPSAEEIRAARAADRDAQTPVAERVWALRNVAGTLAMGGPGERARARQLLEQAVALKQADALAPDHPAVLPELMALVGVLERDPSWASDASEAAGLALRVLANVAAAMAAGDDGASAALLMEAALRRLEETAGVRSAVVRAATRRADQLMEALTPGQRDAVRARSRAGDAAAVVQRVAEALTDELGAYKDAGDMRAKARQWDEDGAEAVVGRLMDPTQSDEIN